MNNLNVLLFTFFYICWREREDGMSVVCVMEKF